MLSAKWRPFCRGLNVLRFMLNSIRGSFQYKDEALQVKEFLL